MKRHYFISNSLDDLELVEQELESKGVTTPQIHVFSNDDADVEKHHLHSVSSFMKKDVVRLTMIGALIGFMFSSTILLVTYLSELYNMVGWVPFIFLSIVVLGFCTWEGGLLGIQKPHHNLKKFDPAIKSGKHVLFVDIHDEQASILNSVVENHSDLVPAGEGEATPSWIIGIQDDWRSFLKWAP